MKPTLAALAAALLAAGGLAGCASSGDSAAATQSYVAQLQPMNTAVTRTAATGTARFTVSGDRLTIDIDAQGVHLIFHLARAGWVTWHEVAPKVPARPGKSGLALRLKESR